MDNSRVSIKLELGCKKILDSAGVGLMYNSRFSRSWAAKEILIQPELGLRTTLDSAGVGLVDNS